MNITRINAILVDSLGEVDGSQRPKPGSEAFNFFVVVLALRTAKVHEHASEMIRLLKDWPGEAYGQPVPSLGNEINYLVAGAVLESQQCAFMLFAFGKILDWWDILDPHTVLRMEYDNPQAREFVGKGMITIKGYRPKVAT